MLVAALGLALGACGSEDEDRPGEQQPPPDETPACTTAADCTAEATACRAAVACTSGQCIYKNAPDGTPLLEQATGDCAEVVCDGAGGTRQSALISDVPDDGLACTVDGCDGATPKHTLVPEITCYTGPAGTEGVGVCQGGTRTCNADGVEYGPCVGEMLPQPEVCDPAGVDEDCDAASNEEGPGCACGDGFLSAGEACDDGNLDPTDLCTADCQPAACGDGIVQPAAGETCDDGNTTDADGCSAACNDQVVVELALGAYHGCARLSSGRLKCWGSGGYGQLGLDGSQNWGDGPGEMGSALPFVDLGAGRTATALSAGRAHTCVLLDDGSVKCWGSGFSGRLGLGDVQHRGDAPGEMGDALPAVDLGAGKTPVAINAGGAHTCALLDDGSVKCWGDNTRGQLGLGDVLPRGDDPGEMGDALPAVNLGTGATAVAISAGEYHTCAVLSDGAVKCWGGNDVGNLGTGDTESRGDEPGEMGDALLPVSLGTGVTAAAIDAGRTHTCVILTGGSLKCWGWNDHGELGLGDTVDRGMNPFLMGDNLPPVNLGAGKTVLSLDLGYMHTCVVLSDSTTRCWGINGSGELGRGHTFDVGTDPAHMGDALGEALLGTGVTTTQVAAGDSHSCALLSAGNLKCWGSNLGGQLGLGDINDRIQMADLGDNLPTVKLVSDVW